MTTTSDVRRAELVGRVEEFRDAYMARDLDRMTGAFAEDAELTATPGTFRGKDAIRDFLAWDARLSPTAVVRDVGIGLLVCPPTVVWEREISLTYEGVPYQELAATVIEFDDANQIRRYRSYYDKLAVIDEIAHGMPGLAGLVTRSVTGYLVRAGKKGLNAS